jgi:hypothetical protein
LSQWVEVIVTTTKLCLVEVPDNLSTIEARDKAERVILDNKTVWDSISAEEVLYERGIDPYDEVYKL